ncbi:MAG: phosphatidic acid phosphatase [Eubacteriales bacterium]|nr:phosphatidic acid phosphatase [Eubacteriales bacterium]
MKKPVVDYRTFRLNKLSDPEFSHLKLLGGWIVYFLFYFLTENLIPAERCTPMHCIFDDMIPFREEFVVFYVGWYVLIVVSLLYFMLYNVEGFRNLCIYIMITQAVAMTMYILFPTRQDLRPEVFPRENFFTWVVSILYAFDTSTGVCPSLHVAYSLGIGSVFLKEKSVGVFWKALIVFLVIMISLSTAFIKQHSVVDIFAALALGVLAEALVYGKYWGKKLRAIRT